jgi:probable F420-dependent oxidoreductase
VDFGIMYFPTDRGMPPDQLARLVEERGYESLWMTEHTHIPVSRRTPWPGGGHLPEFYKRIWDPFVALAAAAAVTERVRLGTGVCLVAQHEPLALAKATASLDLLSGGRFVFGVGVGWNHEEMQHHGVDPATRRAHAREHVLAVRELWTQEEASFDGEFVSFDASWSWPKPVQRPHPPIVMGGGGGPVTFRHVVEYCDGWMPLHGRGDVVGKIAELRRHAESAGRDPDSVAITVMGCPPDVAVLGRYAEAGVARCTLAVPGDPERIERMLERHAAAIGAVAG